MRHVFGEVQPEYRIIIGIFIIIILIAGILAIFNVANSVISQLLDLLKAVLGGLIGGEIVKRSNSKP
jgi:hypothetical protein